MSRNFFQLKHLHLNQYFFIRSIPQAKELTEKYDF